MQVMIQFDTDNAAFEDDFEAELRAVMKAATDRAIRMHSRDESGCRALRDTNGNLIGWTTYTIVDGN